MCGISGILLEYGYSDPAFEKNLVNMTQTLVHRGPDDFGVWVDNDSGVGLGHRRLSIIDLSPAGHQPMVSPCGRYVCVFNGEIYNHKEIKKILNLSSIGIEAFRGNSDTEIMLAAISQWGLEEALRHFDGMFAIAIWDRKERLLYLVRDRLGEKPLYYGWGQHSFLFASELKAMKAHPGFRKEINYNSLAFYLNHGYIPAPHSIYKGVFKLPPGTYLAVDPKRPAIFANESEYWSLKSRSESLDAKFSGNEKEAIEELDRLLRKSVQTRMLADVPVGAFLSGGTDSSLIVALMQLESSVPVKTFTIGFAEQEFDEAYYAKQVALHLHTEHTELYVTPSDSVAVLDKLALVYDEPFADVSQIPTLILAALTRKQVTVALSGDGGDELFGGYSNYFSGHRIWETVFRVPLPIRKAINHIPIELFWKHLSNPKWINFLETLCVPRALIERFLTKTERLIKLMQPNEPERFFQEYVSHLVSPGDILFAGSAPSTVFNDPARWIEFNNTFKTFMYLDLACYLPDNILVKVDRATMSVALEARIPLLDHKIVEFALSLPLHFKIRNNEGKYLLKQLLCRYVDPKLIQRPKKGFGVPIDCWLRGPYKDWAHGILTEPFLNIDGTIDAQAIRTLWQEHQSGRRNRGHLLWNLLMLNLWLHEEN